MSDDELSRDTTATFNSRSSTQPPTTAPQSRAYYACRASK